MVVEKRKTEEAEQVGRRVDGGDGGGFGGDEKPQKNECDRDKDENGD